MTATGKELLAKLEKATELNAEYLRTHAVPPLYEAGIRYAPDSMSESFSLIPAVQDRGFGDADDIVAWRVAELRALGERAQIRVTWKTGTAGQKIYGVQVLRSNGTIEDPVEILRNLEGKR